MTIVTYHRLDLQEYNYSINIQNAFHFWCECEACQNDWGPGDLIGQVGGIMTLFFAVPEYAPECAENIYYS